MLRKAPHSSAHQTSARFPNRRVGGGLAVGTRTGTRSGKEGKPSPQLVRPITARAPQTRLGGKSPPILQPYEGPYGLRGAIGVLGVLGDVDRNPAPALEKKNGGLVVTAEDMRPGPVICLNYCRISLPIFVGQCLLPRGVEPYPLFLCTGHLVKSHGPGDHHARAAVGSQKRAPPFAILQLSMAGRH